MTLRDKLDKYNIDLDANRSQFFLHNELVIDRMVDEADVTKEDTVLEIGAGIGNITRKLAEQAGQVIAYENDSSLVNVLKQELQDYDNVKIVEQDFSSADVPEFDKCVSNIPFALSSEITEFLAERQKLSVLLVQKAFAKRLIAEPGSQDYSRITVTTNYYAIPVFIEEIYDINFVPPPPASAAIIKLFPNEERYDIVDETFFFHTLTALFVHQKKKLRNAFYDSRHMFDLEKEEARDLQDEIPYADERVFDLDVKQFVEVANTLHEMVED